MEKENIIRCPECRAEIDVNDVLYHQVEERIKKDYEKKLLSKEKELDGKLKEIKSEKEKLDQEKENFSEHLDKEVSSKLKTEKIKIEKSLRQQIKNETSDQIRDLEKELESRSNQVRELNKTKAEIEKLKREKEELREQIILEKEKEFGEKLKGEKFRIKKQVEEENVLKIKEKEKVIDDLKNQLDEAKRRAELGSAQLQGEIQEIELENILRDLHKFDEIIEIKKGQKGADILQIVKAAHGNECGKIYYESKRTKGYKNNWIQKLRNDNLSVKADILVLVTETLPEGIDNFDLRDGVWICSFHEVRGLSVALRHGLMRVHEIISTQHNKGTKMELLYNYLTSQEFKGQFEAIIEGFKELQGSYNDEKLKMQKIWKEREKQLEKILTNAVDFYGSLKGIAGASIPHIKMLEGNQQAIRIE